MVMVTSQSGVNRTLPHPAADARADLRRQSELRRSGATVTGRVSNPVNLRVPSFSRVSNSSFDDHGHLPLVRVTLATEEDDLDW
jgi:hypothetical protein